jgi:hypothetical protein
MNTDLRSKACLKSQAGHALTINKPAMSGYDLIINLKELFYKMSFDVNLVSIIKMTKKNSLGITQAIFVLIQFMRYCLDLVLCLWRRTFAVRKNGINLNQSIHRDR